MSTTKTLFFSMPHCMDSNPGSPQIFPIKVENVNFTTHCLKNNIMLRPLVSCTDGQDAVMHYAVDSGHFTGNSSNKRKRLDNLSMEEKLLRKKLKNRVAAQCSRDRKKAKVDELEAEMMQVKKKNALLISQCHKLKLKMRQLSTENEELRSELSAKGSPQTHDVDCSPLLGPAVSTTNPLPQGWGVQSALGLVTPRTLLWNILMICLSSPIFLKNYRPMNVSLNSKSWQKVCSGKLKLTSKKMQRLLVEIARRKTMRRQWWGPHQKMWNPVEK